MERIRKNQYILEMIETLVIWGIGGTAVAVLSGGFSDLVQGQTLSTALLLELVGRMLLSIAAVGVAGIILWAYAAGARALVKQGNCGSWVALALFWGLVFGLVLAIVLDLNTRLIVSRFYLGAKPLSYGLLFKTQEGTLRGEVQHKLEIYREAMDYLAKCPRFDESAFRRLDGILAKAGVSFGAAKRQEMIRQAQFILPTRTTGGMEELRAQLQISLSQASEGFNRILEETSARAGTPSEPTPPASAEAVMADWAAASADRLGGGAPQVGGAEQAPVAARKPSDGSNKGRRALGIALLVVVVACLAFMGLGIFTSGRLPTTQGQAPAGTELASEALAAGTKPTSTRAPSPTPTPQPFAAMQPIPSDGACFYSSNGGMVCLGADGWQSYTSGEIDLGPHNVDAMEACSDGQLLLFTDSMYAFDGLEWHDYGRGDFYSVTDIDCNLPDDIWVAHFNGVARFDGKGWSDFPLEQILGTQEPDEHPQAVVADGQGSVWIALNNSLAHYDGEGWTFYREGQGLSKTYYFKKLARDSQFTPWAAHSGGLLYWDGGSWKTLNFPASDTLNDMVIDSRDRVWVGTTKNVRVYENQQWRSYKVGQPNQASEWVRSLWVDGQDRVWVGTRWGLSVLDQTGWTSYHMHTSALPDNDIDVVIVLGDGPPLAEPIEKEPGQLTGRVLENGVGVSQARVEVCVEYIGTMYFGSTPCSGQPLTANTTTDSDGYFAISDLPTGYYYVTLRTPKGEWKVLSSRATIGGVVLPSIGGTDVLVSPGQTTTLEDMEIGESE